MKYYSVNNYIMDTFGRKLYKIAIDGGFTCPNRDGTLDTRGCIFCDGGSGDFAQDANLSVTEQIEKGKRLVEGKLTKKGKSLVGGELTKKGKRLVGGEMTKRVNDFGGAEEMADYIAYFQAFTGTYAPVERLRSLYFEALNNPDIAALSIATRPDCINEEVLGLIAECNLIKPTWVELGLQTSNEKTAEYIRRGYPLFVYDDAVRRLNDIGIPQVITHIIIGLPGEGIEDIRNSVRHAVNVGTTGLKLQLLHVLKGTDLAEDFKAGKFEVLSMEEYGNIIIDLLGQIPDDVVVHRITGDGNKRKLIAPLWSGDKKRVLNYLNRRISEG